jgi:septum formation protein
MAVTTEVTMREFSEAELQDYLSTEEWQGKAGAYAVQGMAAAFVSGVHGSISNVIGLPLAEVVGLLAEHGVANPSYQHGISA